MMDRFKNIEEKLEKFVEPLGGEVFSDVSRAGHYLDDFKVPLDKCDYRSIGWIDGELIKDIVIVPVFKSKETIDSPKWNWLLSASPAKLEPPLKEPMPVYFDFLLKEVEFEEIEAQIDHLLQLSVSRLEFIRLEDLKSTGTFYFPDSPKTPSE